MSKIKFLKDTTKTYDAKLIEQSQHVMRILFTNDKPDEQLATSGFYIANEYNFTNMTGNKYYSFTNIYRELPYEIDLSDDGEKYVEVLPTLEEIKVEKLNKFSELCAATIIAGVDVELSDGKTKHFSYTTEDQTNIKELFDIAISTQIPQYYHADGESCTLYPVQDIIAIYAKESLNKLGTITYYNQLKLYVNTIEDIDLLNSVKWGDALTGEYLETYQSALEQAQNAMKQMFGL